MDISLDLEELQKDFDPEEHDRMMKKLEEADDDFNEDQEVGI
jgi:hypothetical protein